MGGLCSVSVIPDEDLKRMVLDTGFKKHQIIKLHERFCSLDKAQRGYLTREDLLEVPEIENNPVGEMLVNGFFPQRVDEDGEVDLRRSRLTLDFTDFLNTVAVFRPDKGQNASSFNCCKSNVPMSDDAERLDSTEVINSRKNKAKFLFSLIDRDGKDYFTKEELYELLQRMTGANVGNEQLSFIADRMIREADQKNTGIITFEDFYKATAKVGDAAAVTNIEGFRANWL